MKEIELTKGRVAIVDDEDYEHLAVHSWYCTSHGYAATRLRDGKETHSYMHAMILNVTPPNRTDHANGNKLDNRRQNLRPCTRSQNAANTGKFSFAKGCSSLFKGVSFDKPKNLWMSCLKHEGNLHRKRFRSEHAAARFYNEMATIFFGEFAVLNVITGEDRILEGRPRGQRGPRAGG